MKRALFWADRALQWAAGAIVVALLATVMAGVVSRALNQPLAWTDEASGFLMVWLACLGWTIATRHGAHIRISVFQDLLPRTAWRVTEAVILLAAALIGAVVAVYSVHLIRTNADIESLALPISAAWLYVPLLPAGVVTLLQALADLWRLARAPQSPTEVVAP